MNTVGTTYSRGHSGKGLVLGSDFAWGFFIVDENGEKVFSGRDRSRYFELLDKHRTLIWPDTQPLFEKIDKLKQEGLPWETIVPQSGFFPGKELRPMHVQVLIVTRFYDSWKEWLSLHPDKRNVPVVQPE